MSHSCNLFKSVLFVFVLMQTLPYTCIDNYGRPFSAAHCSSSVSFDCSTSLKSLASFTPSASCLPVSLHCFSTPHSLTIRSPPHICLSLSVHLPQCSAEMTARNVSLQVRLSSVLCVLEVGYSAPMSHRFCPFVCVSRTGDFYHTFSGLIVHCWKCVL